MPGVLQHIFPKGKVDYGNVTAGGGGEQILAKIVDVSAHREGVLVVRTFATNLQTGNSVAITVKATSTDPDDQSTDFVGDTLATATITATGLKTVIIQIGSALTHMGPHIRVTAKLNGTATGQNDVTVAVDLSLKS